MSEWGAFLNDKVSTFHTWCSAKWKLELLHCTAQIGDTGGSGKDVWVYRVMCPQWGYIERHWRILHKHPHSHNPSPTNRHYIHILKYTVFMPGWFTISCLVQTLLTTINHIVQKRKWEVSWNFLQYKYIAHTYCMYACSSSTYISITHCGVQCATWTRSNHAMSCTSQQLHACICTVRIQHGLEARVAAADQAQCLLL